MVTEKIRKYIERRGGFVRFWRPSAVGYLMRRNPDLTRAQAERLIRLVRLQKRVERLMVRDPSITRPEAERVIALRTGHVLEKDKSKGESMTSATKSQLRRVISMAAFVVAVYFAVAAYVPGDRWVDAHLLPGHVVVATGFLCVCYLLWPKK